MLDNLCIFYRGYLIFFVRKINKVATRKIFLKKDVTGLDPDNYFEDEVLDIGSGKYRTIRPKYGAFFKDGFVLKDINDNIIDLSKIYFTDLYGEATMESGKSVWNSALLIDPTVSTNVKITYHGYGGLFSRNAELLLEWVNEKLNEAVPPINFLDLLDRPREFIPDYHLHLWKEVYGWKYIKPSMTRIENAIKLDKSVYFNSIIENIQNTVKKANEKALTLAKFYADDVVNTVTANINKETLGIHLLANLSIASKAEMSLIASNTFDSSTIQEDKFINKKGLVAFTEVLKNRSVSMAATGLGLINNNIKESKKGTLLALGNQGIVTLNSKKEIIESGNFYEENVYPKNFPEQDKFVVLRVSNNVDNYGGAFLGFNNTTGEMYSGILTDDRCFMRIKWFKFYSELTYDKILEKLNNHIHATNNPHKLTKKQIRLEKVANLPVATLDQIMGDKPVDAYMTLDGLNAFMVKHLLDLKPEFNEDGTLKKDSDLFNKPNVIFTPCDKKVPNNCPPKGQILKVYCDGTDRFKRVADGMCSFTDEVVQLDSDDCKYFEINPQGKVLYERCDRFNRIAIVADGRGGTTEVLVETNSEKCGYEQPPGPGTVISEGCVGFDYVKRFADGNGGVIETITEINSPDCGFTTTTTTTTTTSTTTTTTTTSTTPTPIQRRIVFQRSLSQIEPGATEVFTASFTGYPPNTLVPFRIMGKCIVYTQQHLIDIPELRNFLDFNSTYDGTVQINASGQGYWTLTQVETGFMPRVTTWEGKIVDDIGTQSNIVVKQYVNSGGGSTPRPTVEPPTTTTTTTTTTTAPPMSFNAIMVPRRTAIENYTPNYENAKIPSGTRFTVRHTRTSSNGSVAEFYADTTGFVMLFGWLSPPGSPDSHNIQIFSSSGEMVYTKEVDYGAVDGRGFSYTTENYLAGFILPEGTNYTIRYACFRQVNGRHEEAYSEKYPCTVKEVWANDGA